VSPLPKRGRVQRGLNTVLPLSEAGTFLRETRESASRVGGVVSRFFVVTREAWATLRGQQAPAPIEFEPIPAAERPALLRNVRVAWGIGALMVIIAGPLAIGAVTAGDLLTGVNFALGSLVFAGFGIVRMLLAAADGRALMTSSLVPVVEVLRRPSWWAPW
jgi:hypothetical protein